MAWFEWIEFNDDTTHICPYKDIKRKIVSERDRYRESDQPKQLKSIETKEVKQKQSYDTE